MFHMSGSLNGIHKLNAVASFIYFPDSFNSNCKKLKILFPSQGFLLLQTDCSI